MYSQTDIRYHVSDTVATVRSLVNAFPGDITLCIANKTVYQYVEYGAGESIPVDDGSLILQTTDTSLFTRWVALSAFTAKSIAGTFIATDWQQDSTSGLLKYTIALPNKVRQAHIKFYDIQDTEVYVEKVNFVRDVSGLSSINAYVAAIPDCSFAGKYVIFFDGLF